MDTASIKNHIAKGSYTKDDLKDGTKLTSISNETLYVTRTEDDVQINGVKIEGNAIKAGNSYVYVVPEVIPMIEAPTIPLHETTITTKLPTGEALAGVNIEAKMEEETCLALSPQMKTVKQLSNIRAIH